MEFTPPLITQSGADRSVQPSETEQQAPMAQVLAAQVEPKPAKVWPAGQGVRSRVQTKVVLLQQAATIELQTSIGTQEVPAPAQPLLLAPLGQARWSVIEHAPVVVQQRPREQMLPEHVLPKPCQTPGSPETAQALVLVG